MSFRTSIQRYPKPSQQQQSHSSRRYMDHLWLWNNIMSVVMMMMMIIILTLTPTTTATHHSSNNHNYGMNQVVVVAFHPTTTTTVLRNGQDRIPHIQRCTTPSAILLKFHTPSPKMRSFTRLYESIVNGEDDDDDTTTTKNEIVARRIIVQGDVQGGYYRSCVLNEVCSMQFV